VSRGSWTIETTLVAVGATNVISSSVWVIEVTFVVSRRFARDSCQPPLTFASSPHPRSNENSVVAGSVGWKVGGSAGRGEGPGCADGGLAAGVR
jgi:hypothetical protein